MHTTHPPTTRPVDLSVMAPPAGFLVAAMAEAIAAQAVAGADPTNVGAATIARRSWARAERLGRIAEACAS